MSALDDMLTALSAVYADAVTLADARTAHLVVDSNAVVSRHAVPGARDQPLLHLGRERRGANVEAQLDRGRDLIDVLTAGARGADEPLLDVAVVEDESVSDSDQFY